MKALILKFADLSRNQLPINFKGLIGLKIFLVKFPSVPRAQQGVSLSIPSYSLVNTFSVFLLPEDNSGGLYHC